MKRRHSLRITKLFTLEMGHALLGHDGQCHNIHGHSYKLFVTLSGTPLQQSGHPKDGMIIDFTDLKKIVQEHVLQHFDHALVLNQHAPDDLQSILTGHFEKVRITAFQPTCENLLLHFVEVLEENLPSDVTLYQVRLDETATSFAEWCRGDHEEAD
ncbi:MAG: 6-carboxytetrahydropterin synthase [Saprospiraceae bacterium]|nr:6-carboxytetrahydropterin synthase [Saprospiraceae bacterium]